MMLQDLIKYLLPPATLIIREVLLFEKNTEKMHIYVASDKSSRITIVL